MMNKFQKNMTLLSLGLILTNILIGMESEKKLSFSQEVILNEVEKPVKKLAHTKSAIFGRKHKLNPKDKGKRMSLSDSNLPGLFNKNKEQQLLFSIPLVEEEKKSKENKVSPKPLVKAIKKHDSQKVNGILKGKKIDINKPVDGDTPLITGVKHCIATFIKYEHAYKKHVDARKNLVALLTEYNEEIDQNISDKNGQSIDNLISGSKLSQKAQAQLSDLLYLMANQETLKKYKQKSKAEE
ncbi:MAG: hypothetical protein WDZ41_00560 [Candidatus Babeliales bacterium]